ncbi:hypothetical protein FOA43_002129 [Brettanomyces nanus]|uniref:Uncharacterized protein n=1 Tax=Eeniella nana TaxID=13502 RepID=A0A875S356_EENNA|nr:uncharacterized protein FOA43_002129 [Brettanomyces nanus]QPG74795.1 hypothetical protein FOA43_002129 [Brettanomyces nanus]
MHFQSKSLYGGAITVDLPEGLIDASTFRQIPDTQEVYVCHDSKVLSKNDAIIIDLMERVDCSDDSAIDSHLREVCKLNDADQNDSIILEQDRNAHARNFPEDYCGWIVSGEQAKKWGRDETPLVLILALIRLKNVGTDLLVSYNIPFDEKSEIEDLKEVLSGESLAGNLALRRINVAKEVVIRILDTLKVQDWKLFKN